MKIFAPNAIDAYKYGHYKMVPEGTDFVYTNATPRSMRLYSGASDKVVVLGHQGILKWFLKDMWDETFFNIDKEKAVKRFKRRADSVVGKGVITVSHIEKLHDLGFMPLTVRAIDEGEMVNPQIPTMTIETSEGYGKDFYWLVNFLESALSSNTWKAYVNATIAKDFHRICKKWSEITCDNDLHIPFQCHDFSFRGLSTLYDCAMNGIGHLTSFNGTDSILPIDYIEDYYNINTDDTFIAGSVAATEHYVTTLSIADIVSNLEKTGSWQGVDRDSLDMMFESKCDIKLIAEYLYYQKLITELVPNGILSIVADSYSFWDVVEYVLPLLKNEIMSREGKIVVRPDSSCPVKVLTGYKVCDVDDGRYSGLTVGLDKWKICNWAINLGKGYEVLKMNGQFLLIDNPDIEIPETEVKGLVQCLYETFGGEVNNKGYKVLDSHIGAIYGDSITLERAEQILDRLAQKGFASSNVVFGIGSYTYNYSTRDTVGMAYKATYGEVNGVGLDIYKEPKTDPGKKSAKGLMRVLKNDNGEFYVEQGIDKSILDTGELKIRFKNGELLNETTFEEIRDRLNKY